MVENGRGRAAMAAEGGEGEVASPSTMSLLDELDSLAAAVASSPAPATTAEPGRSSASLLEELDAITTGGGKPSGEGGGLDSLMSDLQDATSTVPKGQAEMKENAEATEHGDSSDLGSLMSAFDTSPTDLPTVETKPSDTQGGEEAGDLGSLLAAFGEELATEPATPGALQPETTTSTNVMEPSVLDSQVSGSPTSVKGLEPEPEQEPESNPDPTSSPQPNLDLQQAVRDLYREHVPSKPAAEVEANLRRYAGREEVLLRKVRKKYLEAAPPASAPAASPTAEEGDPPAPAMNTESDWIKYLGLPAFDAAGTRVDRAYYRHRLSEELTLHAPPESVREIREEKDTERFEMDWRRAGGVMPEKEGWGSWIKRGVVETTAVFVDPATLTSAVTPAPKEQQQEQESWGSWLKKKAVGAGESPAGHTHVQTSVDSSMTREDLTTRTASIDEMMVLPHTAEALAAAGTDGLPGQGSEGTLSGTV